MGMRQGVFMTIAGLMLIVLGVLECPPYGFLIAGGIIGLVGLAEVERATKSQPL